MSRVSDRTDYMALDDFEELLADMPHDQRWELIGGRVVKMMVGARWEHHFVVQSLASGLRDRLRATGALARFFTETFYMKNRQVDAATLPDVLVRCGPLAPGVTSIDDPVVLVEVVSAGSEGPDRAEKWRLYRKLPSLRHYVLVERDRPFIDIHDRVGDVWANLRTVEGLDAVLDLPALAVSVPLREIYQDVLAL